MSSKKQRMIDGLMGHIIGDALGVPVEFKSRSELDSKPVSDMVGYGTHDQPPGTWSDDSSMTLITVESLLLKGYDPKDMLDGFCKWAFYGYMTPYGKTFSIGKTTVEALKNYRMKKDFLNCGLSGERDNGNGSLMRILPASIYFAEESDKNIIKKISEVSALTHSHIRSKLSCILFSFIIRDLINAKSLYEALANANRLLVPLIPDSEKINFKRILNFEILQLNRTEIRSSGYVIDTLEAVLWSVFNSSNTKEALLTAVNLGGDTDTIGAITGGLAGIIWGLDSISSKWLKEIAKKDKIYTLIELFAEKFKSI